VNDGRIVRLVTIALALICGIGMVGIFLLANWSRAIPEVLSSVTTTGLGALSALLVSTHVPPTVPPSNAGPTVPPPVDPAG
jgi:hypothetical protein